MAIALSVAGGGFAAATGSAAPALTESAPIVDQALSSTEVTRHLDRYVDVIDVASRRSWMHGFSTTWTQGVRFLAPAPQKHAVAVAYVETTRYRHPDGVHVIGENGAQDELPSSVTTLLLPAHQTGSTLSLRARGDLPGLKAIMRGTPEPSISISGLPRGVAKLELRTSGAVGAMILRLTDGCRAGAVDARSRTAVRVSGQRALAFSTAREAKVCVKPRKAARYP